MTKRLLFASVLVLTVCMFASEMRAQTQKHISPADTAMTAGKRKVEAAYGYQRKLQKSLVTMTDVLANWQKVTQDKDVRRDKDALAIAYGCEGQLDIQLGRLLEADSVLRIAMPLFKFVNSKAFFLVALAENQRKLSFYGEAMKSYHEILRTMDSLPQLEQMEFYRESGYAAFAYGIDAALGIGLIGTSLDEFHDDATTTLRAVANKHSRNALGLMALTALMYLDTANHEDYQFRMDRIFSVRPKLRKVAPQFDMQFEALKPKG